MAEAVGILEVFGLATAFVAADAGSVEDVTAAVEAGMAEANRRTGVVQHYVIPNPTEDTVKMLKISALDKS